MYDEKRANEPVDFIQLLHLTDDFYGRPFVLQEWEKEVIRDVYGTLNEKGYRQYSYAYLEIPKKNGKALAVDTPIPTPSGWTTMGKLKVGDYVFGDDGKPAKVVFATNIMYGHRCYEVAFSDGSKIIADKDHLWETTTYIPWLKTSVKTTEEIKDSLCYQKGFNHKIKLCKPVEYPQKELPVNPYVLGVWLGDGESFGARVTCDKNDMEIMSYVALCGYPVHECFCKGRTGGFAISDSVKDRTKDCFQKELRRIGVFGNKHIPNEYLTASIEQRFELLRGLMDTDGTVSKAGQCSYTSSNKTLFDGVLELINSLGFKATYREKAAVCNGKNCGKTYELQFWAYNDTPVFKLKRKLLRQKQKPKSITRTAFRKIVSVNEVPSVPVKCIQVDNQSKLYLAGKSFIPTHNTTLIAGLGLFHLICDGPGGQIYCCAADRDQASLSYQAMLQMIDQDETLQEILQVTDSKKVIRNKQTGTFLKVLSAEAYTKHGLNPTVVIFDELHAQPNRDLWDVMTFGAGAARKQVLYWVITTAGDDPDRKSIGWEVHEYARRVCDGEIDDPYWYVKIYSAPDSLKKKEIFNEKLWYEVNPSLGTIIDIDEVRKEAVAARNNPNEERLFRWLRLNQWNKNKARGWLPLTAWDATTGNWTREDLKGCICYGGLDLATTWDMNGFALIFPPQKGWTDYRVIFDAWIPEENMKERVHRDHVQYDEWARNGFMQTTEGNVTDYSAIRARILSYYAKMYKIREIGFDKYNANETTLLLVASGIKMVEVQQSFLGESPAMKELEVLFKDSERSVAKGESALITHEANPAARWCYGNVNKIEDGNGNYRFIKDSRTERIDIFAAMVDAMARTLPHMAKRNAFKEHGVIAI